MAAWSDGYWWSNDGLRLHYRDYAGSASRPPIICIPGLTRNARDFEGVAERLAGEWRVICVDLRGRGESAYAKDPMTYVPLTYWQRLRGTTNWLPTWLQAARYFQEMLADVYPDWSLDQWLVFAKRICKLTPNGRIAFDYDMRIAEPFKTPGGATGFDLWEAFAGLKGVPSLVVRGEISDLLDEATVARMLAENPAMEAATVPRVGHAPTLDEPEAIVGIDRLLARVEQGNG